MYNGIGLPTARGSGTNGYIQSNKFFARTKVSKVLTDPSSIKGFESGQGTAGVTRKANKEILEHDRKRQIELKLLVLEEKLTDQGYTDAEIAEKLQGARLSLQAQAAAEEDGGASAAIAVTEKRVSDTQTHQIAARKEQQMEKLRAALGIGAEVENQKKPSDGPASDSEDIGIDDKPSKSHKKDVLGIKRHGKGEVEEKDDSTMGFTDKMIEVRKQKESRRARDGRSSETDSDRKVVKSSKKNHRRRAHSSESEDESDNDVRKRRQKSSVKQRKSRRHDSDYSSSESGSESDSESSSDYEHDTKHRKSHKRHESDDEYSSDEDPKFKSQKVNKLSKRGRHDSKDESSSDVERRARGNHYEKKRNEHRDAFRSEKGDIGRDDRKVSKGRRDTVSGRYESKSNSDSDRAHKSRRHDSGEDESGSDIEKEGRRNHSKKRNERQNAFRSEKDDIVRDGHRVRKGRRDGIGGRYDLRNDSDSDEAPKAKNKVENNRRRHDSDDESDYDKKKIQKSRRRDSDEDDSIDSRDNSSESDASERSDYRHRRSDHKTKSLVKNHSHHPDDQHDRERKTGEKVYEREDDGTMKHRRASKKVDDGLDTLRKLENLYQAREDKMDGSRYEDLDPKRSKRKIDDGDWNEQPERKSRRRDLGKEAEHGGAKNEPEAKGKRSGQDYDGRGRRESKNDKDNHGRKYIRDEEEDRKHDRDRDEAEHGGAKNEPEAKGKRSGQDYDDRSRRESENDKDNHGRKHRRDEKDDRKHDRDGDNQRERHRREQEEDHVNRYGRDRDIDSSKRGKYDDSRAKRRRYDDDRYDERC